MTLMGQLHHNRTRSNDHNYLVPELALGHIHLSFEAKTLNMECLLRH